MTGKEIRERLHSGDRVYGTHVCSFGNPVVAKMTVACDFDFVFICNEHIPIDRTETSLLCQFWAAHGVAPIVRVPSPEAFWAAMALDAGAQGIVVPYVETVAEVERIVGAVKYRPIKGKFLQDIMTGRRVPAPKTRTFLEEFNRDHFVIIGVESVEAVRELESLIDVPGVDGVFLGPHDLTVSMEIPTEYNHPDFIDLVEDVILRCRRRQIGVGLHSKLMDMRPENLDRLFDAGMNWIVNGADIVIMRDEAAKQMRLLRELAGDYPVPANDHDRGGALCIDSEKSPSFDEHHSSGPPLSRA